MTFKRKQIAPAPLPESMPPPAPSHGRRTIEQAAREYIARRLQEGGWGAEDEAYLRTYLHLGREWIRREVGL